MYYLKEVEVMLVFFDLDMMRFKLLYFINQKDGVGNSVNCNWLLDLNERRVY